MLWLGALSHEVRPSINDGSRVPSCIMLRAAGRGVPFCVRSANRFDLGLLEKVWGIQQRTKSGPRAKRMLLSEPRPCKNPLFRDDKGRAPT